MNFGHDPSVELSCDECRALLERCSVGRVGFTTGALPAILPVVYWVDNGHIHFPAWPGSALHKAAVNAVVVFSVDDGGEHAAASWSVLVTGQASVVPPSAPWDMAEVVVQPSLISGRRTPSAYTTPPRPVVRETAPGTIENTQPTADRGRTGTDTNQWPGPR
jgi:nitroimidazol reductase NimA-like FMN-containing flavoprotein (pyridoxamine 5'-phosphate oxidase superfamily)